MLLNSIVVVDSLQKVLSQLENRVAQLESLTNNDAPIKVTEKPVEEEEEDDDFDPFAEEEGDDEEAEKLKAKRVEEYNQRKSKSKFENNHKQK